MQVVFTRWCVKKEDRVPVSINPVDVAATEEVQPVYTHPVTGKTIPAATKVTLRKGKEMWVVGDVVTVVECLNDAEAADWGKS